MKKIAFVLTIIICLISCEKEAGEGGTCTIQGKVIHFSTSYNTQTSTMDTTYFSKSEEDVYIIYSNDENEIYNDNFETDWDGNFHFQYLRKGDYTIYTYADSTDVDNITYDYPVFKHITIEQNNSVNTLTDFIIKD